MSFGGWLRGRLGVDIDIGLMGVEEVVVLIVVGDWKRLLYDHDPGRSIVSVL